MWKWLKEKWCQYWEDDEADETKQHLSQRDKRSIWCGVFLMCVMAVSLSNIFLSIRFQKVSKGFRRKRRRCRRDGGNHLRVYGFGYHRRI